ncbi:Glutathione S-transferase Mu 2 [Orchesella cincta]|uniref:Glutathione S-transferase n=1 Tax=Orchesella cincta TaxID=48709 RepID=A0A1D2M819_ORCCI|nr:Glutathione S-transferase Mu 2 [Orchesella cincta]
MAPVQLAYWDIRGLAQPIRLLLEYTGTEWEDKLYACGPAPDFDKSCWFPIKESLGLDFPNLPYLIDGDVKLSQTQAILRYIARKNGLLGADDTEAMKADLVAAEWADFNAPFVGMCYSPDFAKLKPVYLSESLPVKLKRFSAFLGEQPYFAGKNITFADFLMYEALDQHKLLDPTCLKPYKNLEDFVDRIENLDRIKGFLKSSRVIKYPLNNKMASFGG